MTKVTGNGERGTGIKNEKGRTGNRERETGNGKGGTGKEEQERENGKRETANGKRQTANGKRETETVNGERAQGGTWDFKWRGWLKDFWGFGIFDSGIFLGTKIWQVFFWVACFWGVLKRISSAVACERRRFSGCRLSPPIFGGASDSRKYVCVRRLVVPRLHNLFNSWLWCRFTSHVLYKSLHRPVVPGHVQDYNRFNS